jgi:hypothetical protein
MRSAQFFISPAGGQGVDFAAFFYNTLCAPRKGKS